MYPVSIADMARLESYPGYIRVPVYRYQPYTYEYWYTGTRILLVARSSIDHRSS